MSASAAAPLARPANPRSPLLKHAWLLPAAAWAFAYAVSVGMGLFWDNDMNYIVALGRSIIADGLPWEDPLTCNEGLHCIAQQWLFCVGAALLFDGAGKLVVEALCAMLWAGAWVLVYLAARRLSGSGRAASLSCALCLAAMLPFMKANPRPFDIAALVGGAWAAEAWLSSGRARLLAVPVACSLALANLHCTMWPVAAMPLSCALLDGRSRGRRRALLVALAVTVAASAASPYGIWSTAYVFLSLSGELSQLGVGELKPAVFSLGQPWCLLALAGFALWACLRARRVGGLKAADMLCGLLFLMTCAQMRNGVLFLPVLALCLSRELAPVADKRAACVGEALGRTFLAFLFVLGVIAMGLCGPRSAEVDSSRAAAVDALRAAGVDAGAAVANTHGTGGWLELEGYRPEGDERAELTLPQVNGGHDLAAKRIAENWHYPEALASRASDERFEAFVLESAEEPWYEGVLAEHGWRLAAECGQLVVWVRG